jgi:DamX protein
MPHSTPAQHADHYVNRLDLGDDPFSSQFDSDYYFTTTARQQLLDQLVHFSRFSDQVVMLVGATGSGTSTLLDQAILRLREVMDCCYVNAEVVMTAEQVMESLCQQLHFHWDEPASNSDFFTRLRAAVEVDNDIEPILIAVDQAHFLPLEGFELLRSIVADSGDMVRLLLVGEYQAEPLAGLAKFDREQTKILELEPLSQTEAEEYLLGLLRSVGYAGEPPFSADQLAVLHEQAAGSFAELKQLAPALLSSKPPPAESRFRFGIPIAHAAASAIIGIALIMAWLYQGPEDAGSRVDDPAVAAPVTQPVAVAPGGKPQAGSLGTIDRGTDSQQTHTTEQLTSTQKTGPKAAASSIKIATKPAARPVTVSRDEAASAIDTVVGKPPVPAAAPVAASKAQISKPTASQRAVQQPIAVAKPKAPKPVAANPVASGPGPQSARERRLLELAGTDYMLQLMGSVDMRRTEGFVKRYAGRLPVTYFETRLQNKPWFVAIVGPYDNKTAAVAQIMQLPVELQKQRPWARSVASIQKDIRAKQP